jgi:hypothetical protein
VAWPGAAAHSKARSAGHERMMQQACRLGRRHLPTIQGARPPLPPPLPHQGGGGPFTPGRSAPLPWPFTHVRQAWARATSSEPRQRRQTHLARGGVGHDLLALGPAAQLAGVQQALGVEAQLGGDDVGVNLALLAVLDPTDLPGWGRINQLGYHPPVEKGTPHCKLSVVKALVERGEVRATASAFAGARALGINNLSGLCEVVMSLTAANFHKSRPPMQTIASGRTSTKSGPPVTPRSI